MNKLLQHLSLEDLMDLKIDYAFKQLFGNDKNKDITKVLLNAILNRTGNDRIRAITFENTEFIGEYEEDKASRLDILATSEKGERINIEIQFTDKYNMVKRSIYYWSRIASKSLTTRSGYEELPPIITINIVNFNIFKKVPDRFHTVYHLYEDQSHFQLSDVMELHFLEMPKLLRHWRKGSLNPRNDILARWLLMLGMIDRKNKSVYEDIYKELEDIAMNDETLREAFKDWEKLSASKENQMAYESRFKEVMDAFAAKREADLHAERRWREGIQEGEKNASISIAKRLLKNGHDVKTISEATGLTSKEIEELRD